MQIKKIKKYANKIKYAVVVIIMASMGILYTCNFNVKTDDIQLETIESIDEYTKEMDTSATSSGALIGSNLELAKIYVFVCGCVVNPGVYELKENMRVFEAINLAGGMTEKADINYLNIADFLIDGQKVYVPDVNENLSSQMNESVINGSSVALININSATKEQLMSLPGVGESRANDIISYRTANGRFLTIEDIMKISGIKESSFNKIKDLIVVK